MPPRADANGYEFGLLLYRRRCAALLTRDKLALLAKLSESTIKLTERGRLPSQRTLLALLTVPELQLSLDDLPDLQRSQIAQRQVEPAGVPFLRLSLDVVELATREQVLCALLRWIENQHHDPGTETLMRLQGWAEQKLEHIRQKRADFLPASSSPTPTKVPPRGGRSSTRA